MNSSSAQTAASRGADPRYVSRLTRETLALVMAGGRGSRLHALTDFRAKPAVPFAGKFRIIDFTLSNCLNSGIRRIGVLTQYHSHSLTRHLQQAWGFLRGELGEFVENLPAQQRSDDGLWYRGTADAVYQNLDIIRAHAPRMVLVLAGDHIYKMDYGRLLAQHVESGAQLTIGCIEVPLAEASAFGVMAVDEQGRILKFAEKPKSPEPIPGKPDTALASMGIYVFDIQYLIERLLRDAEDPHSKHDFGGNIIPGVIATDRVFAHTLRDVHEPERPGFWRDVGTLDAYWATHMELTGVMPEFNLYDEAWPIWTHMPSVPPAKFVRGEGGRQGTASESLIAGGCILSGSSVHRSVLFSGSRVDDGAQLEDAVVLPNARIGRRARIHRAIIDEGCVIPEGMVIGEDAARDAKRFHLSPQGLVLVTPTMLGQHVGGAP
jgi:glucose-1-phosphate adenylyltransferase